HGRWRSRVPGPPGRRAPCLVLLNPHRRHCRHRDKRGCGWRDSILLYQMAVSTQSIRSKGSKRGLQKILHTPQTSMGRLSGQVQNPGKFRRTMFAGLLRHLMGPLMVGSVAAAVAAMPVIRSARAANDQNEGSGLPLPRFVSLKSDHVNVRGGPNKDHDVAWVYTRPALPVEIT